MKQKIHLSLNDEELGVFRSLVNNANIPELQRLVAVVVDREDVEAFIIRRVLESLSDLSGLDLDEIKNDDELKWDLGLTLYHKRSLKTYFQNIFRELREDNLTVTIEECENLGTVEECFELVKSKL